MPAVAYSSASDKITGVMLALAVEHALQAERRLILAALALYEAGADTRLVDDEIAELVDDASGFASELLRLLDAFGRAEAARRAAA
jgi:hypothetical protein